MSTEAHPSKRRYGRSIFPPSGAGQAKAVSEAVRWILPILVGPAKHLRPNPEMSRRENPCLESAPNPTWRLWSNRWLSPVSSSLLQQRSLSTNPDFAPLANSRHNIQRRAHHRSVVSGPVVFESDAAACCPDTTPARGPTTHLRNDVIHKSRCLSGALCLFQHWFRPDD